MFSHDQRKRYYYKYIYDIPLNKSMERKLNEI